MKLLVPSLALGLLLSACGGGADAPEPTPVGASLTVTAATNAAFNGVYSTSTLSLSEVEKINPIGGEPEVCSFKFSGLQQVGGSNSISGDIRYIPGNPDLRVVFMSVSTFEFVSRDSTNAAVNRTNSIVNFNGKTLAASTGVASAITVTGGIPMRGSRPEGC
ncbi:MAG TPA: hypothetical protein VLJ58_11365 [Ramlibacter sp.]|nr:hypothetical protein [Ramlibacter sp.]